MTALLVQTVAVWFTAGSVATMQVLNYPLLALIGPGEFTAYEQAHNRRFAVVVGPGVLATAVTAAFLLVGPPAPLSRLGPALAALLLVAIVAMTAVLQAPAHARLASGFDAAVHRGLVRSNAVRALLWVLLGVLDVVMLAAVAGH